MDIKDKLIHFIETQEKFLTDVSEEIWNVAEMKYEEFQSADLISNILRDEGFELEKGVGGIETAFIASYGKGYPIIGVLGEYDALSGMSQQAGVAKEKPVELGGNGHGCGHNLLGVGSLGAVVSLKEVMKEEKINGTIRYYGCPAEEGGSGKTFMVRSGLFDDVDVALTWHPGTDNSVSENSTLANYQVSYRFKGKSSHAAISPHLGRSALDAVELMNVGVNYLREHIVPEARVHYAVTHTGGDSPNVVQADAEVLYLIRAPIISDVEAIYNRINNIAEGAAKMTGTTVEIIFDKGCSNVIPNRTLNKVMHKNFKELGTPTFSTEEEELAKKFSETIYNKSIDEALNSGLEPYVESVSLGSASTDVGDVSWVVPTVQCSVACFAKGTPFHSWQMVAQGGTSIGYKGMIHASKVIGLTALELFMNPNEILKAKEEWEEQLDGNVYKSPIPEHINPPIKFK